MDYMRTANLQLSRFYPSVQEEWNCRWNGVSKKRNFPRSCDSGRDRWVVVEAPLSAVGPLGADMSRASQPSAPTRMLTKVSLHPRKSDQAPAQGAAA